MELRKFPKESELEDLIDGVYCLEDLTTVDFKECVKNTLENGSNYFKFFSKNAEFAIEFKAPDSFNRLANAIINRNIEKYFLNREVKIHLNYIGENEYGIVVNFNNLYKLVKWYGLEDLFIDVLENFLASKIMLIANEGKRFLALKYDLTYEHLLEICDALNKRLPKNYTINIHNSQELIIYW